MINERENYRTGIGTHQQWGQEQVQGRAQRQRPTWLYLVDGADYQVMISGCITNQISANVPPALANGEDPKVPAIQRETIKVTILTTFCEEATWIFRHVTGNLKEGENEP